MAFDPDAYLAKKPPSFNPDEYLKSKPKVVEPILSPEEQVMGAFGAPPEGGIASIARPTATKPPSELAPGEEFGKGLGAGVISLKSMWESAGLMKDIGAMSTVQQRQDLFNKIETGQISSPDQLRGLDESSSQARAYLMSDPATREKLRERNVGEIGRRTDFVKAALTTVDQYQKDAQKYKGRTTDLTDVEGAKDFANWLSYNVGSGAVQLAPIMIAAATTGGAGVAALGIGMGTGEAIGNRLEFLEKRIKDLPPEQRAAEVIDYVKKTGDTSLAVGIVSGALDAVLGPAATLAKRGLGEVVKGETRKEALKAGVKEIPKGMGQEFITGGAQEATQLGGALAEKEIDEFLTKENAKKILNAAAAEAAGALGGGAATTGARVYGADQAIRAKEKQDAQRQELQGRMSELDELLKTVYGQEAPVTEEQDIAKRIDDVLEKYGKPTTQPPAEPEAGIAGLAPQPSAPPAPPAAPVDEEAPAQDLDAMLREALGATEADINTVNMPKLPEAPVAPVAELNQEQVKSMTDEQLKAQINNINLRDREYELVKAELDSRQQPPSTALIEETLPEAPVAKQRPSTPVIYNAIIDGYQGNAGKLPEETLNWMTENGLIKGGTTTPLGQRLMDTVKQAEEAYKSSQSVGILEAMKRGEPMPTPKSMSMDQVDEVVDKFIEANKPKVAPKVEAKPAATTTIMSRTSTEDGGVNTVAKRDGDVVKDVTRYSYNAVVEGEPVNLRVEKDNKTGQTIAQYVIEGRPVGDLGIGELVKGGVSYEDAIKQVLPGVESIELVRLTPEVTGGLSAPTGGPAAPAVNPKVQEFLVLENQSRENRNQKPLTYEQALKMINEDVENDMEFGDFDTSAKRMVEEARSRLERDAEITAPSTTVNISKTGEALRGKPFQPDELDKKAIEIYKKIKAANPDADIDREIQNPNVQHPIEEQPNSKGIKIGDLVYKKGDPTPRIAITVGKDSVKLLDQKAGKGGFSDIESVSKEPIDYDYTFDFGYGEINVNVDNWLRNKDEWQFSMYGPGASGTGFRSALGIPFKGEPGTKQFKEFVENVVRSNTADRPLEIAKEKAQAEKNLTPAERKKRKDEEAAADKERLAKESSESDQRTEERNQLLKQIQETMKKNKTGIYSPMPTLEKAMETIDNLKKGTKTDVRAEGWMRGQGIIYTPGKKPQFTRMGKRFVSELYKLNQKLTDEQRASGSEDARVLQAAVDKANAITNKEREKAIADKQKALEAQGVDKAKLEAAQADINDALSDLSMLITKGTRLNIMPEDEQKLMPILTRLMDGAFRAGYYKFKDAARYVMDLIRTKLGNDFADEINIDQLQGAYIGMAGKYQDQGASSKKEVIAIESMEELEDVVEEETGEAPEGMDINDPDAKYEVAREISESFLNNGEYRDITEARKAISEMTGEPIKPGTKEAKAADEAIEAGVVMAARAIVAQGRKDDLTSAQIYDKLVDLYERQPNLNVRSSTSVAEQAYSTPAPLAFIASELAGINSKTFVYEPTAGNGMLLIGASKKNIIANELNSDRFEMLSRILDGAEIGNENALDSNVRGADFDVVIENPPFGKAGQISDIDHAIAMHSLEGMKDDGKAVLILGGVQANTEEGRREGYRGKAKREFYYKLYNKYNVVDHFTAGGNMYAKQGTTYPVDIIVIDGVGKSKRDLPAADLPQLITSYEQLKEKLNDRMVSRGDRGTRGVDSGVSAEGQAEPEGVDRGAVGQGERAGVEGGRPSGGGKPSVSESESTRGGQREPSGGRAGEVQPRPTDESERDAEGRPIPSTGKRGEAGGKAGAEGRKPSELGGVSVVSGERVGSGLTERAVKEEETTNQVSYTPHSQATAVGTLVPKAMAQAIEDSISRVENEVGNIDEFVAEQLNMDTETLREQFSAEQIDALVLAIRNAEEGKGFIIGDQTGVGKGRVVAAMIKYALNTGKIPIFVTEKPNLYSDMIRDLDDIGMTNELGLDTVKPKIFMTNSSGSVPYTLIRTVKGEPVENNLMLKPVKSSGLDEVMKQMVKNNSLGNYKVIFTTYSQLQSVKGKPTERQNFIKHFGAGNYMIFDESHNAGGAGVEPGKAEKEAGVNIGQGRSGFVRNLVKAADGTFFSSATYAKRPDVMDLYSSTDMKLAVDNITQLSDAIKAGGIPMQQTVANMLTQAGQYIRRERTFAGVAYNTQETKVDKDTAENMATSMRDILAFSREKEGVIKKLQKSLDNQGARAGAEGEKTTVQGANFGSIMHNLIDQMLLSLKAQDSVRHAIERLKAGEKVVMTVSNTMGSFLQNYADDMDIKVGDPVNLSFADLYIRYLDKQRMVTITKPGGIKEQYRLTDEDLGPNLANRYYEIVDFIRSAGFGSAPISPIDYMHSELRKVKIKGLDGKERNIQTQEITGRTVTLNYESGKPLLTTRSANIKQRVNAVKSFNSGESDVIILNQAGSTGLSLHAKSTFKDKRKRHMIIVQPEKNIDTHMQMLGRVHRTGQVIPPAYSQMMADIPAEMRPAAVLLKKMASLNANTTASRKSAVSAEGAVDFMNDYGGQVAQEFLRDNPGIHADLGGNKIAQVKENTEEAGEEDIRKLTGYIPILPLKLQEEVYKDLIERYNELIEREDSMGSNKLEAKAQDLDAQTVSSVAITKDKGEPSIFAQPAYMEKVDVRRTVRPYSKDEVKEQVKENLGGKTAAEYSKDLKRSIEEPFKKYFAERIAEAEASNTDPIKLIGIRANLNSDLERVQTVLDTYRLGTPVAIKNVNGVFIYGVVSDIKRKGKTKNPAAGSDWKMTLALANGDSKSLPLTFSQIGSSYMLDEQPEVQYLNPDTLENERIPLMDLFDRGATVRREKRWMVTGNILSGFAEVKNMGTILTYTKNDGTTAQGILMPRTFDFEKEQKNAPVRLRTADEVMRFFGQFGRNSMVSTPDAVLRIKSEGYGSIKLITSSSKREGGTFFLDKGLTDIVGDFYKSGSIMSASVYNEAKSRQALEYILNERQDSLVAASDKDKAREMFAPKEKFVAPLASVAKLPPGRSPELTMAAQLVESGAMTKEEYDQLVNFYKPIKPLAKPLEPATEEQVYDALDKVKREKVDPEIMPGVEIGLRLDIPAFNRKGVYVVSIHSKGTKSGPGKVIGYSNVAKVRDVTFGLGNERSALKIAGGAAKDALQTIEGKYVETTAEKAFEEAQAAFNDPQWVQIGVDPTRHSYFYDKNTTQPVVAAEEVIQIGNMVLGKNVTYGSKENYLFNPGLEVAVNAYTDRDAMIEEYARLRQKRAFITDKFAKGQAGLTEQQMVNEIDEIAKDLKNAIKGTKPQRITAGNFFTDATKAWDAGVIEDDVYDVIDRLYKKFPEVLEGLRFSVTKQPQNSMAAGEFFALPRIVRLYKGTTGTSNPETIRHEIVHSLEQMMSLEAITALVDDWRKNVSAAIKAEKTKEGKAFFDALLNFHASPSQEAYDAMIKAMPSMDYYQYVNPSEYWAVNAEPLMARKLGTGWDKFVLMARRLFEGLKYIFGFDNKRVVHRVFNEIMNAKGQRIRYGVLANYVSHMTMPLRNMVKNYKGGPGALATWEAAPESTLRDFKYRVVDKHTDMRMVVKQIEDQIDSLKDEHDPSLQEDLYHSSKSTKTEDFIKEEMRPFIKKMDEMGVSMGEFEAYLHARHAGVRNKLIAERNPGIPEGGSGMFDDEIKEFFDDLNKHPEKKKQFEELAKTIDEWVEGTQDMLVSYGLETPETIQAWREKLPGYVPLKRDPDELDYVNPSSGLGQGFGVRGSFSKLAAGSYKTVVDIVNNVALQREAAIIRGEKAKVGRALYALAIQNPNPNFWKVVNPDAIRNKKKLKEEMEGFGLTIEQANAIFAEPSTAMLDETTGLIRYRVNPALRNSSNVFPVRINGKDRYVFFNAGNPSALRMSEALKNMDANQLSYAMGLVAEVTRLIAAMNTQYNPVFGAWNFARDVVGGSINLSSTELKDQKMKVLAGSMPAMRAIFTDLRGMKPSLFGITANPKQQEWIDLWREFRAVGGITGYSEQFSRAKNKTTLVQRELARLDHGNVRQAADAVLDWLSDYNDTMENAVRLSAYKAGLDAGMTSQRAAALAKNLTVNFNRKGQATANANALYAFFNARVQGTARMMEVMYDEKNGKISMTGVGKKIIAGGMLIGTFQAIALMAAGFDGDEPPDFLKSKNIIIPTGNKTYFIIPMPLGWNLFPNIGREVTEYVLINAGAMKGRRALTTTMTNVMAQVIDMFNPLGAGSPANFFAPTVADPIVNVLATNKDAFGRPISRESRETTPTPGWERSRDTATKLSKALAYGINYITGGGEDGIGAVSPTADQLDYIAREYAGGVGREITKVARYISRKIEGEEIPAYSVPIGGKLYGELDSPSAVADKFYKNVKAMAEHEGAIKRIKERKGDVNDYRKENKEATARLINRANYVENEVAKINREIRALNKKEAPEKDIKFKKEKRDALMKAYNEEVRRAQ